MTRLSPRSGFCLLAGLLWLVCVTDIHAQTTVIAGGAGTADANTAYKYRLVGNYGVAWYSSTDECSGDGLETGFTIRWNEAEWEILRDGVIHYTNGSDTEFPPDAGWVITADGTGPAPALTGGTSPFLQTDTDATLTAAAGVEEPVSLSSVYASSESTLEIFDFSITDGATMDGLATLIQTFRLNVSGTIADPFKLTFLLDGPGLTETEGVLVDGVITFSDLDVSVSDGANRTFIVRAFWNDPTGLVDGQTLILSIDGDTDVILSEEGTQMATTEPVTNGSGSLVDIQATRLAFTTQPAGSVSGIALETQPVVRAQDADGNVDLDFDGIVTLSEESAGTLEGAFVDAVDGIASFIETLYAASTDQEPFALTASADGLESTESEEIISDVVATRLVFDVQPSPLTVADNELMDFQVDPVVRTVDEAGVTDTDYASNIILTEVNGAGTATMTSTDDENDGDTATVIVAHVSGVATFTGLVITYTTSDDSEETFNFLASSGLLTTVESDELTASVNTAPVAQDDVFEIDEDDELTGNLLEDNGAGADADDDGDDLTVNTTPVQDAEHGAISIEANGEITYTPEADFYGVDAFAYEISDGAGGSATAEVTITINPVNDAPVISAPVSASTDEDTPLEFSVGNGNAITISDIDAGEGLLEVTLTAGSTATLSGMEGLDFSEGDGTLDGVMTFTGTLVAINTALDGLIFTPDVDFSGAASLSISVDDLGASGAGGPQSSEVAIPIAVDAVNDAPSVSGDLTLVVDEGGDVTLTGTDLSASDVDDELSNLTFTATDGPTNGIVIVDGIVQDSFTAAQLSEGLVQYGHNGSETQSDSIEIQLADGGEDGAEPPVATINVAVTPVNDAPTVTSIANQDILEDAATSAIAFTVGDEETAPGTLGVTFASSNLALIPVDHIVLGGSGADHTVTITPVVDLHGTATITVTVSDGDDHVQSTFDVVVRSVNDAPSFTEGADQDILEDAGPQSVPDWASNISPGPSNEGSQTVTFDVTIDKPELFASLPAIDLLGKLTFTPAADANGTATITITAKDDGETQNGGVDESPPAEFTIAITPVNDAPVIVAPGPQTTLEEAPITFSTDGSNAITVADVDAGATDLTVTLTATSTVNLSQTTGLVIGGGADGSETVTFSGTLADINAALEGLVYTPSTNQIDGATLTVEVSDGELADTEDITVNITPVNDIPDAIADLATIEEDTPTVIDVLANDTDSDGDELAVSIAAEPTNGAVTLNEDGSITYIPAPDFFGADRFDYTATDPSGASDTEAVRITVTSVNDAPVAAPDEAQTDKNVVVQIDVLANDSDVEGSALEIVEVGLAQNGKTVSEDGNITYTPEPNYSGVDTFSYTVTDGELTARGEVTVTIIDTNSAPVALGDAANVFQGNAVVIDLLKNDSDPDGDALSIASHGTPSLGTITDHGDGSITYQSHADAEGQDTFIYTVADPDGLEATANVTVTVGGPGPDGDGVDDVMEDGAPNDGDGDADGIPDSEQNNVSSLPIVAGSNAGQYVTVASEAGTSLRAVASTQNPSPDDFPEGVDDIPAGFVAYEVQDLETGQSTIVTLILPTGATAVGYLKYGPTPDNPVPHWYDFAYDGETGAVIIPAVIEEGAGTELAPSRILLHLTDGLRGDDDLSANGAIADPGTPVLTSNTAPSVEADAATIDEDTQVQINLLANDADADGDVLTVTAITQPANGATTLDEGTATYTPEADFFGDDSFTYTVTDSKGASLMGKVAITVMPVEDAPVAQEDAAETPRNTPITIDLFANDSDADGDAFWLTSQDDASGGKSVYNDDGTVTYTPQQGFLGTDSWTYTITDGPANSGQIVRGTISVSVFNRAPTFESAHPIIQPEEGERVYLGSAEGSPQNASEMISIEIQPGQDPDGDPVQYGWELALDTAFEEVIHLTEMQGTSLEVSMAAWVDGLAEFGIVMLPGDERLLYHRGIITDGIDIVRADVQSFVFVRVTNTADVPGPELPTEVFLSRNYPNPFNPSTTIEYGLPESMHVRLDLYDVSGRHVRTLVDGPKQAGIHRQTVQMDHLPSGVYLYRLMAGERVHSKLLHMIK